MEEETLIKTEKEYQQKKKLRAQEMLRKQWEQQIQLKKTLENLAIN